MLGAHSPTSERGGGKGDISMQEHGHSGMRSPGVMPVPRLGSGVSWAHSLSFGLAPLLDVIWL